MGNNIVSPIFNTMGNLLWKRVNGNYHINTTGVHASNRDAVITEAITMWIKNNSWRGHVDTAYKWLKDYLFSMAIPNYYPGQDSFLVHHGNNRSWFITQHMLKYYAIISDYLQWWLSSLALREQCLTLDGNMSREYELSQKLVGSIIEDAVEELGWFVCDIGVKTNTWVEKQGRHYQQHGKLSSEAYYELFFISNAMAPKEFVKSGDGWSTTTVDTTVKHLNRNRQPQQHNKSLHTRYTTVDRYR